MRTRMSHVTMAFRQLEATREKLQRELSETRACERDLMRDLPVFKFDRAGEEIRLAYVTAAGRIAIQPEQELDAEEALAFARWLAEMASPMDAEGRVVARLPPITIENLGRTGDPD
jgi:hypothetical protein